MTHLASLARLLPERDPHEDIYEMLERTLDDFDDVGDAAAHLVRFELAMLAELGFGLDLENCAATGETADLVYVSPKSGGAVSRPAGEPWRDRLLRLPAFLREGEGGPNGWSDQDLQDGFRLTGLFLLRHVLEPRGQGHSDARDGFINAVTKHRARRRCRLTSPSSRALWTPRTVAAARFATCPIHPKSLTAPHGKTSYRRRKSRPRSTR